MRIENVLRLGVKELRGLLRDRMMLLLVVYSFSLAVYMDAKGMPETLHQAPIAIVDGDRSALSSRIANAFAPPHFGSPRFVTAPEMDRRLDSGQDTFALDIPAGFQRDVLAGRSPALQLNVDATRVGQAFTGVGYVSAILDDEIGAFAARSRVVMTPPVGLALRARFNPSLDRSWFGALSNLVSSITMLAIVLAGAALIREREHGTVEHLLAMPVAPVEIMLAKVWSMSLVVLVASALSLAVVVRGVLGVPIEGSVALFLAGALLHLFASTCLGITLATVAGSMPQFGLLLMLVMMPLQMLSGTMTPRESMPELVRGVMLLAPNTHFVILSQAVLFRGAGLAAVWWNLVALCAIGAALFAFALRRFRAFLA